MHSDLPAGAVAPAWYIDPDNPRRQRYWNGARWSSQTKPLVGGVPVFPVWEEDLAPDDESLPVGALAWAASRSASTLHTTATMILVVLSLLMGLGVLAGLAELAVADTSHDRVAAGVLAGACVVAWLFSILPYLAAQALARYIQFRTADRVADDV